MVVVSVSGIERTQANIHIAVTVREKPLRTRSLLKCLSTCHGAGECHAQADAFRIDKTGS